MSPADPARALLAPHALLPGGWARDVLLAWDAGGRLVQVAPDAADASGVARAPGLVLPGMPNLHSHAFQRAFAGLAEHRAGPADSFWTWREAMYRVADALTPEALEDVATHVYVLMLRAGYTSVCEFQYLHHDRDGRPYADRAELSRRLVAAAARAGIGLTLLPVLYQASGFGAQPPLPAQRRFVDRVEGVLEIAARLRADGVRVGIAPHSLRAVPPAALRELVAATHAADASAPVHIHVAEQRREVDECVAWSGRPPVRWLLDEAPVDARWCLVHATHAGADELRAVAARGATVGLCPTTEANLGDGIFDAPPYVAAGGAWGIGSDSQASVDAAGELRALEYAQRLATGRRLVLASDATPHVADRLWLAAVAGGARAAGRGVDGLAAGRQADFVVVRDGDGDALTPSQRLATHVFATPAETRVEETWVAGIRRVAEARHPLDEAARRRFVAARARLLAVR